ncbi:MAG: hypothetical protein OFPI_09290 [Osedax symbiont Rs2]|nr:MAG: hypothetical protein OFPI_09290 [Osedax symbiont Rs2]
MLKTFVIFIALFLHFNQALMAANNATLVIVRGNGDYSPHEMIGPDNKLTGVHIDIVLAIAKLQNISVQIKSFPWRRALHLLQVGEADAIIYIGKTTAREQFAIFDEGNVLSTARNGFFVLKEQLAEIKYQGDLRQLAGFTIGTLNGYSYGDVFDNADFLTKDSGADNEKTLLDKLIRGRFKVAITNVDRMSYIASKKNAAAKIVFLRPFMPGIKQYIAFSKKRGHQKIADEFATALEKFKKTLEYRQILAKYGLLKASDDPE